MTACLAGLEVSYISVTALVADSMVKAADVRILGYEPTGIETILIRLAADSPGALATALECGKARCIELGAPEASEVLLPRPAPGISRLNSYPNRINALYGGREEMRPDENPNPNYPMTNPALGILETQGLTASLNATDTMLKAADVQLLGKEKIGAAYVAVMITGDVAAVTAAIEAGREATGNLGKLIAAHVIARPHDDIIKLLPTL